MSATDTDLTRPPASSDHRRDGSPLLSVGLWDIGLPIAAYFGLRLAGATETVALLAAGGTSVLRIGWTLARERRFDGFAGIMALVFGIGLGLSYVTGDDRLVLASKSVTTMAISAALFASLVLGKPAAFGVAVRFGAGDDAERVHWQRLYDSVPSFRRVYVVMTTVWAVVMLIESIVRIPLIYLLPADTAVPASYAVLAVAITLNLAWAGWYGRRGEQRARSHATMRPCLPTSSTSSYRP